MSQFISHIVLLFALLILDVVYSECTGSTGHDAEGPYYTANPPIRTDFTSMDPKSDKLFISGQVINIDTCQGVSAKIDFWSANSTGVYDNIGYNMRGQFLTDENGYYSLNTRLPGYFAPRPHHIHVKIWVADIVVLTTQLYFSNYGVGGGASSRELTIIEKDDEPNAYITSFVFVVDNLPDLIQDTEPPEIGEIFTTTTDQDATTTDQDTDTNANATMIEPYSTTSNTDTTEAYTSTESMTSNGGDGDDTTSTSVTCCSSTDEDDDICLYPITSGPCEADITSYGYNSEKGKCEEFSYGGCGGNENRFPSLSQCENACEDEKSQGNMVNLMIGCLMIMTHIFWVILV